MYAYDQVTSDSKFARTMLKLLFSREKWINRRVDSLTFPDGLTVHRHVNLDVTAPKDTPEVDMGGSPMLFLPVATIRKTPTVGFTMSDETDHTLTLLPRPVVRDLSVTMLEEWAEYSCGYTPTPESDLSKAIGYIVERAFRPGDLGHRERNGRWNDAIEEEVEKLIDRSKWCQDHYIDPKAFAAFQILVKMLARDYLVIAVLPSGQGKQRVLTYQYDRPLRLYPQNLTPGHPDGRLRHVFAGSRLPQALEFPAGAAAYSQSYHFQIFVPEEVSIDHAAMYRYESHSQGPSDTGATVEPHQIFPSPERDTYDPAIIRKAATRVDLHPSSVELRMISGQNLTEAWNNLGSSITIPHCTLARARILIGPSRSTWLGASVFISLLSAVLVTYISMRSVFFGVHRRNYFPIAALLAVVLSVIIRPESGLAKFVMKTVRGVAFIAAIPPAVLALLIDNGVHGAGYYWAVTTVSVLAFSYLTRVWLMASPSPKERLLKRERRWSRSETPLTPRAIRLHEQSGWTDDVQRWISSRINANEFFLLVAKCGHKAPITPSAWRDMRSHRRSA